MLYSSFKPLLDHPTSHHVAKYPKANQKSAKSFHFQFELSGAPGELVVYEITETPIATTTKCSGPSFIIILNKIR